MRQIAADPNVEYVEVDRLQQRVADAERHQLQRSSGASRRRRRHPRQRRPGISPTVPARWSRCSTPASPTTATLTPTSSPGYDFIADTTVANDGNGRDSDAGDPGDWTPTSAADARRSNSSWHGTHVAGTVAAVTNNAKGVAGTAFSAKIVPVRVLGICGGYDSDIADGSSGPRAARSRGVPANANPAEVINMSLGGARRLRRDHPGRDQRRGVARHDRRRRRRQRQRQRVAASPANCANVVAVGSATSTGARSSFSNYGALRRRRGAGLRDPVDAQHRHHRAGRRGYASTAAPRWRRRTSPAWSR